MKDFITTKGGSWCILACVIVFVVLMLIIILKGLNDKEE